MMVDLFANSGDTRGTRKGGGTGSVSLCKLAIELQRYVEYDHQDLSRPINYEYFFLKGEL